MRTTQVCSAAYAVETWLFVTKRERQRLSISQRCIVDQELLFLPLRNSVITHAGIAAEVGRAFSGVCLSVCLSDCPRSKTKTVWASNTKHGRHILYSSRSACTESEVKRSKVKVTRSRKPSKNVTFAFFVCPCSKMKTAWVINTKLGAYILYSSRSACIDPEVKRRRSGSHEYKKGWLSMSIRLPMFSSWRC